MSVCGTEAGAPWVFIHTYHWSAVYYRGRLVGQGRDLEAEDTLDLLTRVWDQVGPIGTGDLGHRTVNLDVTDHWWWWRYDKNFPEDFGDIPLLDPEFYDRYYDEG